MAAITDAIGKFRRYCWVALIPLLAACGDDNEGGMIVAAACPSTQTVLTPAAPQPGNPPAITLSRQPVGTALGLNFPLFLAAPPGDTTRLFVVEKGGVIKIVNRSTEQVLPTPFLSVTVNADGEGGLLGLAFHPNYDTNGFFYVNLINVAGDTEIRRYHVPPGTPDVADPNSAFLIISVDQPAGLTNHKAGWLGFGQDGFLYAALGDGGGGGDQPNNAQTLGTLLGKMLRLNVNVDGFPTDDARNYSIPADNPCVGVAGAREEIWSVGLRNPFRNSFDRDTGDLYIADVGQGAREEVNVSTAASGAGRGSNYGWKIMEGKLCFFPSSGCSFDGLTLPAVDYDSSGAGPPCSVTGGYVYRGTNPALAALRGTYFYADFCAGFVRSFRYVGGFVTEHATWPTLSGGDIASFGEDAAGELYIVTLSGGLFRIVQ